MSSSSRAPTPAPLSIGSYRTPTSPVDTASPQSEDSYRTFSSNDYLMDTPSRKASAGSMESAKRIKSPSKVNAHSYCGRHSDEYLFNGLGDLWRSITTKKD